MPVCARCPRVLGRSCCEVAQDERLATLTQADVARIQSERGLAARAFVEEEVLDVEIAHAYEQQRPLYDGYFRHGPVRLTLARAGGACVFHARDTGCTLSVLARPLSCRLYPFEPGANGEVTLLPERHGSVDAAGDAGGGCLAVEEADSLEALQALFGVTPESLAGLAEALRRDVKSHAQSRAPAGPASGHTRRRLRRNA